MIIDLEIILLQMNRSIVEVERNMAVYGEKVRIRELRGFMINRIISRRSCEVTIIGHTMVFMFREMVLSEKVSFF